ncbi:MAG: hypothetical protein U9O50_08780, partial [Acidobacteriota bacterium]|nr:hypothetical protein [Acidobacteriota bacterium]
MNKKILSILGVVLIIFVFQSCVSKPENTLLKRYFDAVSLNDITTMSTMALEPVLIDEESWEIISV